VVLAIAGFVGCGSAPPPAAGAPDRAAAAAVTAGEPAPFVTQATSRGPTAGSAAPAPPSTAGPVGAADPAVAARDAYAAFWAMYQRVNDPPDDGDPAIAELATGPALDAVLDVIHANAAAGRAFRRPVPSVSSHRVDRAEVHDGIAQLVDCHVDDGLVVDGRTGAVLDGDVVTDLIDVSMVLEDGRWKVFEYVFADRSEGVSGCAIA
jgi:hypothetical protein